MRLRIGGEPNGLRDQFLSGSVPQLVVSTQANHDEGREEQPQEVAVARSGTEHRAQKEADANTQNDQSRFHWSSMPVTKVFEP